MKKYILIILLVPWIVAAQIVTPTIPVDGNNKPVSLMYVLTDSGYVAAKAKPEDGSLDVNLQDQTTDPVVVPFNRKDGSTFITEATVQDSSFLVVDDTTGLGISDYLVIYSGAIGRFSQMIIDTVSNDTVFVNTPFDVAYPDSSFLDFGVSEMAVDGSSTRQIFGVRGVSPDTVGISLDITRIIFTIICTTAPEFTDFGDIPDGLPKGLVLRTRNNRWFNIFTVKTNQGLAALMYDIHVYEGDKVFNTNTITGRLTFAGQNKIGVAIRLAPGEDLEFIVQDNLSSLISFKVVAEGHIVN